MIEFFSEHPIILLVLEILYLIGIAFLSVKIIFDTNTVSKTLAYLLLIIFVPIIGVVIYFLFGINFQKNKFYHFKINRNKEIYNRIQLLSQDLHNQAKENFPKDFHPSYNTINFLFESSRSILTDKNHVEILFNGEEKFPKLKTALKNAEHHIHLEYYIYENDQIGNEIIDILIQKVQEGVKVRFLYDDFGSRKIGKKQIEKLRDAGVEVSPVNKIRFKLLANRINYRDHRKIVVIDGLHVFTGGINVSDRYINPNPNIFWRDTHVYIRGNAGLYFQYLFLTNWIFATEKPVENIIEYFRATQKDIGNKFIQTAPSGPDIKPSIMMSTTLAIYEARKRIYITTPYFIPVAPILIAIKTQALAGLDIRFLVPRDGDSKLVNAAAYSYYEELLNVGVKIYFYNKGFVHAKTMIIDDYFSSIGTANMDVRSQELNFEVNTHVYDKETNQKLHLSFLEDLKNSDEITLEEWKKRSKLKMFFEQAARLFSPLL